MSNVHNKSETSTDKYLFVCANTLCGIEFGANRKDIKTCSDTCRVALHRAKRAKKDASHNKRFTQSPFAQWLATNIERAKTLEVVPRTLPALIELHSIYKRSMRANGYGVSREFSVCHIAPVTQKAKVGTLFPQNLVIASATLNAGFGNKSFPGAGHSILKARLNPTLKIVEKTPRGTIIERLALFLGADLVSRVVVKCNLQPSARQSLLDWFDTFGYDERIPDNLHDLKTPELRALRSTIEGRRAFDFKGFVADANDVFCLELTRLAVYKPALTAVHTSFVSTLPHIIRVRWELTRNYDKPSPSHRAYLENLQGTLQRQMFNVLHGSDAADFHQALADVSDYVQNRQGVKPKVVYSAPVYDPEIINGEDWNPWEPTTSDKATAPVNAGENTSQVVGERVTFHPTPACEAAKPFKEIPTESVAFSLEDLEELEALERQLDSITHSECQYDILDFVVHKPKQPKHQSAFARFLSG